MDNLPRSFKAGDELTASIVNGLLRDRWRWRHAKGDGTVDVSHADSDSPPWFSARPGALVVFRPGKVGGTDIASGSLTAPSSGNVTPYVPDPSGSGKLMAASGGAITAYNIWGTAVTANKACWMVDFGGFTYLVAWDC